MAMTTEEQQEYRDAAELLSADELRGMRDADSPEEAAIIDAILNKGVAVEVPGGAKNDDDADDADDDQGDEQDQEDDADDEDDKEAQAVIDASAQADEAAAPAVEAAPAIDPDFVAPPLNLSELDEEFKGKLDVLKAERKALTAKLMAGELEADAYSDLEEKNLAARELLRDQKADSVKWFGLVHDFQIKAAKDSGINYFTDTEKFKSLDEWVKVLAAKGAPAGASDTWFLEQAHKKVMVEFDIAPPTPKTAEAGTKNVADAKKVAPKTVRTPNLSAIPPTLGGLPAAAPATGGDGGEFAHLDKLSGIDYERAIARMTPDQRDRWSSM